MAADFGADGRPQRGRADSRRDPQDNGYPADRIEVIVCSDASTDGTDSLVEQFGDPRVKLVTASTQIGVNEVTALGAHLATGEIFLLTHAKTAFEPGAIQKLARHFADPRVGVATGRIVYRNPLGTAVGSGYKGYWLIESNVRALESRLGLGVVVAGSFEMVRREAYIAVPSLYSNDMTAPLYARSKGFLCRYEPGAVQYTDQKKRSDQEFSRRLRMAVRAWSSIPYMLRVVPFGKNVADWLVLISHKYLRWSSWLFMLLALAANAMLLDGSRLYLATFALQLVFYVAALLGWMVSALGCRQKLLWAPFYFCLLQAAALAGLVGALGGRRIGVWKPVT
ncbi:MAG: glycosyltransferase [Acidobacteria bacterium]|nr:glycosyltransferase [Acidobacteriota bacterium]